MSYKVLVHASGITDNASLIVFGDYPLPLQDINSSNVGRYSRTGGTFARRDSQIIDLKFSFTIVPQDQLSDSPLPTLYQVKQIQLSNDSNFNSQLTLTTNHWSVHNATQYQSFSIDVNYYKTSNNYQSLFVFGTDTTVGTYTTATKPTGFTYNYIVSNWRLSAGDGVQYVYTKFILTYQDSMGQLFDITVPYNTQLAYSITVTSTPPAAPNKPIPVYLNEPWINKHAIWKFDKSADSYANFAQTSNTIGRYIASILSIPYFSSVGKYNFFSSKHNTTQFLSRNILLNELPLNFGTAAVQMYTGAYSSNYYLRNGLAVSSLNYSLPNYYDVSGIGTAGIGSRIELASNFTLVEDYPGWFYQVHFKPVGLGMSSDPRFSYNPYFIAHSSNYTLAFDIHVGFTSNLITGITSAPYFNTYMNLYTTWTDSAVGIASTVAKTINLSPDVYGSLMKGGLMEVYFQPVNKYHNISQYFNNNYIMFNALFTGDGEDYTHTLLEGVLDYPNNLGGSYTQYSIANNFNFSFGYQTDNYPADLLVHEIAYGNMDSLLNVDIGEAEPQGVSYTPFTYVADNWLYSMNNFDWSVYKYNFAADTTQNTEYQSATWSADEGSMLLLGWGNTSVTELKSNFQTIANNVSFEIDLDYNSTGTVMHTLNNCSYWITNNNSQELFENYIYNPILNDSDLDPCGPNKFLYIGDSSSVGPVKFLWDCQSTINNWDQVLIVYQGNLDHALIRIEYSNNFSGPWTDALNSSFTINEYDYSPAYKTLIIPRASFSSYGPGRFWKITINQFAGLYISKVYLYNVDGSGNVLNTVMDNYTLSGDIAKTSNFYFGFCNYANENDSLDSFADLTKQPSYLYIDPAHKGAYLPNNFVAAACFDAVTKKIYFRMRTPDGAFNEYAVGDYAPTALFSSTFFSKWKLYLDSTADSQGIPLTTMRLVNMVQGTEFKYSFPMTTGRENGLGFYAFVGTDQSVKMNKVIVQSEDSLVNLYRNDLSVNWQQKTLVKAQNGSNLVKPLLGISLMSAQLETSKTAGSLNFPIFSIYYTIDACSFSSVASLSGPTPTIDGVPLQANNIVLLQAQNDVNENGLYQITPYGGWSRLDIGNGLYVVKISGGDIYQDTYWYTKNTGGTVWYSNVIIFPISDVLVNDRLKSNQLRIAVPQLVEIKSVYTNGNSAYSSNVLALGSNKTPYFAAKLFATDRDWLINGLFPTKVVGDAWVSCTNPNLEYGHQPFYLNTGYFTNNVYLIQFNFSGLPQLPDSSSEAFELQPNPLLENGTDTFYGNYFVAVKLPLINSNLSDDDLDAPLFTFPSLIMGSNYNAANDLIKVSSLYGFNITTSLWYKAFEYFTQNTDNNYQQALMYARVASQSVDLRRSNYSLLSKGSKVDINPSFIPILSSQKAENSRLITFTGIATDYNSGILAWRLVQAGDNGVETQWPWLSWQQFDQFNSHTITFISNVSPANKLVYSFDYNNNTPSPLTSSYSGVPKDYLFRVNGYQPFDGFKKFHLETVNYCGGMTTSNVVSEWYQSMAVIDTVAPTGSVGFVTASLQSSITITNQTSNYIQLQGQDIATDIKEFRYKLSSNNVWSDWTPMVNFSKINFGIGVLDGYQRIDLQLRDFGNNISSVSPKWQEIKNILYNNITFNVITRWTNPITNQEIVYLAGTNTHEYDNLILVSSQGSNTVFYIAETFTGYNPARIYLTQTDTLTVFLNNVVYDSSNYTIDYVNNLITFYTAQDSNNLSATLLKYNAVLFSWNNVSLSKIYDFTAKKEQIITALCPTSKYLLLGSSNGNLYYYDGNILYGPVFTAKIGTLALSISKIMQFQFFDETQPYIYVSTLNAPRVFRATYGGFKQSSNWVDIFNGTGTIKDIVVNSPGYFVGIPSYLIAGGKIAATATSQISMGITTTTITNPGSGYSVAPTLTVVNAAGDTYGSGASLVPVMQGYLIKIVITNSGSGYLTAPTVTVVPPTGVSGTTATATSTLNSNGGVSSVTLTLAGAGYIAAPLVTFSGGSGNGATAYAIIQYDKINSITIANSGSGYVSTPTVQVSGGTGVGAAVTVGVSGGISAISLTGVGYGYTTAPQVFIYPPFAGMGTTAPATAYATIQNNSVSSVIIQNPGLGYTFIPPVVFVGGQGADLQLTMTGVVFDNGAIGIASVSVVGLNSGYVTDPLISFTGSSVIEQPSFGYNYDQDITLWQSSGSIYDMIGAFDRIYCTTSTNKLLSIDKNYTNSSFKFRSEPFKQLNSQGISTVQSAGITSNYGSLINTPNYYTLNKLFYYSSSYLGTSQNVLFASVWEDSTIFVKSTLANQRNIDKYKYSRYMFDTDFTLRLNQWRFYQSTISPSVGFATTTNSLNMHQYTDNSGFIKNAVGLAITSGASQAVREQVMFETQSYSDIVSLFGNLSKLSSKNYVLQLDFIAQTGSSQGNQGIAVYDGVNTYIVQMSVTGTNTMQFAFVSSTATKTVTKSVNTWSGAALYETDFHTLTLYMQNYNTTPVLTVYLDNQVIPLFTIISGFDLTNEIKFRVGKVITSELTSTFVWKEFRYKMNSDYSPSISELTSLSPFAKLPATGPVKAFFADYSQGLYAITQGMADYLFSTSPNDRISKVWNFNSTIGIWTNTNIGQNLDSINGSPYGLANPYGAVKYQNTFLSVGQKNNVGIDTSFFQVY